MRDLWKNAQTFLDLSCSLFTSMTCTTVQALNTEVANGTACVASDTSIDSFIKFISTELTEVAAVLRIWINFQDLDLFLGVPDP